MAKEETAEEKAVREAKEAAQAAQEKAAQERIDAANKEKTGKGVRSMFGWTRGRNPIIVFWEAFDLSLPDTLPSNLSELMAYTGIDKMPSDIGEKTLVSYGIDGYNSAMASAASDPVAEFVDASWPEDVQKGFRTVVRNYASNVGVSIEEAAGLIKPAYLKSQEKK